MDGKLTITFEDAWEVSASWDKLKTIKGETCSVVTCASIQLLCATVHRSTCLLACLPVCSFVLAQITRPGWDVLCSVNLLRLNQKWKALSRSTKKISTTKLPTISTFTRFTSTCLNNASLSLVSIYRHWQESAVMMCTQIKVFAPSFFSLGRPRAARRTGRSRISTWYIWCQATILCHPWRSYLLCTRRYHGRYHDGKRNGRLEECVQVSRRQHDCRLQEILPQGCDTYHEQARHQAVQLCWSVKFLQAVALATTWSIAEEVLQMIGIAWLGTTSTSGIPTTSCSETLTVTNLVAGAVEKYYS